MIPLGMFIPTTLYEIVTVPLYWRIIYVLMTNKEFSAPFYKFIWIIGICENAHYIADVLYFRLPMVSFTADLFDKSPSRWLSLAPFAVYFFNYPVYFMQVAVSLNRFTALWMPIKHKELWKHWWRLIVLISFICSLCLTAHRLPFNATTQLVPFMPSKPELGYVPSIVHYDYYTFDTNLITSIFYAVLLPICIVVNYGTLLKIIKLKKDGNLANVGTIRVEFGLFLVAIWMLCTLIVLAIYQAVNFMLRNNLLNQQTDQQQYGLYILFLQQPWVGDVGAVSHPWVLIAVCKSIRNATLPCLKGIFKRKCSNKAATPHFINVQPAVLPQMRENRNSNRIRISPQTIN